MSIPRRLGRAHSLDDTATMGTRLRELASIACFSAIPQSACRTAKPGGWRGSDFLRCALLAARANNSKAMNWLSGNTPAGSHGSFAVMAISLCPCPLPLPVVADEPASQLRCFVESPRDGRRIWAMRNVSTITTHRLGSARPSGQRCAVLHSPPRSDSAIVIARSASPWSRWDAPLLPRSLRVRRAVQSCPGTDHDGSTVSPPSPRGTSA